MKKIQITIDRENLPPFVFVAANQKVEITELLAMTVTEELESLQHFLDLDYLKGLIPGRTSEEGERFEIDIAEDAFASLAQVSHLLNRSLQEITSLLANHGAKDLRQGVKAFLEAPLTSKGQGEYIFASMEMVKDFLEKQRTRESAVLIH